MNDPKPKPLPKGTKFTPDPKPTEVELLAKRLNVTGSQMNELASRVSKLEGRAAVAHAQNQVIQEKLIDAVNQLQRLLKTTIRAIERLAKGKSLGALGLPSEEDWK